MGEYNGFELNQQSALALMLPCLFKLIIQDRAPPTHAGGAGNVSLQSFAREIDDGLLRLSSRPD